MPAELSQQVEAVLSGLRSRPDAYLVAIAGIPGSGKSTLGRTLVERVPGSAVLPMDGYHLPRSRLSPEDLRRRGAPHTFDPVTLRRDLESLRRTRTGQFPSFDHAVKDPEPDAIRINPETTPVFVEGLYLLLPDWDLAPLFDFTVFLHCDPAEAMARIARRHVECGICSTLDEATLRTEENDLPNARIILDDGCAERADLCLAAGSA